MEVGLVLRAYGMYKTSIHKRSTDAAFLSHIKCKMNEARPGVSSFRVVLMTEAVIEHDFGFATRTYD